MTEHPGAKMPRPSKEWQSLYSRQRIVSAARTAFTDFGFDGATYELIARRAGLTRPALYYYFPAKVDLYQEVFDQSLSALVKVAIARAQAEPDLASQVQAIATAALDVDPGVQRDTAFVATSFAEVRRHPDLLSPNAGTADLRRFLTEAVEAAMLRGELAPDTAVTDFVDLLLATLWGISIFGGLVSGPAQLAAIGEQLRALVSGMQFRTRDGAATVGAEESAAISSTA